MFYYRGNIGYECYIFKLEDGKFTYYEHYDNRPIRAWPRRKIESTFRIENLKSLDISNLINIWNRAVADKKYLIPYTKEFLEQLANEL